MSRLLAWLRGEPVMVISGAVGAVLEVLVAFNVGPNVGQRAAILGAIPLILGLIVRAQVTPTPAPAPPAPAPPAVPVPAPPPIPPLPVIGGVVGSVAADVIEARLDARRTARTAESPPTTKGPRRGA